MHASGIIRFVAASVGACALCGVRRPELAAEPLTLQSPAAIAVMEPLPPVSPDGESDARLTLADLEQLSLGSNPSLARLAALVGAARGNAWQAGLPPNPNVGYQGQQLGSGGLAEQHGVVFSQEIIRGGKLRLSRAVADRDRMRAEQELIAQELRVLTDVRIGYFQALLAQRQVELAGNLVQIGEEGSRAVNELFSAEEVGRADVLQAQLEVENARLINQNSRNRYLAAWQELAAVVGDPTLAPQELAGDPTAQAPFIDYQGALLRILSSSPEIAAAMIEIERANVALQRARVEPVANVSVEGLVNWRDNGIGGKPDGGVAVSVPIPVFNRNQGAIAQANHEVMAARQALNELELSLQKRLAATYEQYSNARAQEERYREMILPSAEESLSLTRKMYSAGEANFIALLTAQRTYSQTQLNYLDALRSLRIAEAEIEGMLLSDSLETGGSPTRRTSDVRNSPVPGGIGVFGR
ncbi:MAG: TolC family protein [Planctomycetaceae bacterium]|nr:TolC family protein [Planctomycetaceae bacterium]